MGRGRGQGLRVEADLGVGEVVIVEQDQVRLLQAGQAGHLRAFAVDVQFFPVHAYQLASPVTL